MSSTPSFYNRRSVNSVSTQFLARVCCHVFVVTCLLSRVCCHVFDVTFVGTCLLSRVCWHVFVVTCLMSRVCWHVFVVTCLMSRVCCHVFVFTCLLSRFVLSIFCRRTEYFLWSGIVLTKPMLEWKIHIQLNLSISIHDACPVPRPIYSFSNI